MWSVTKKLDPPGNGPPNTPNTSKYLDRGGPDTSAMYCSIWTPSEVFDPPIYIEWGIQYFSISVPIKDDRTRITNLWGGKGRLR